MKRLQRIDALIQRKATGFPAKLAQRLAVSKATISRDIQSLQAMGAPIRYCKCHQSYIYEEEYMLKFK